MQGFLRLVDSNPFTKPIIQGNYLKDPQDIAVLIEGIEIALSLMNSTILAKYNISLIDPLIQVCSQFTYISKDYWKCAIQQNTGPENHQAGSCKMGTVDDEMAVVDSQLRVYGIQGLRVADASIMPQVCILVVKIADDLIVL